MSYVRQSQHDVRRHAPRRPVRIPRLLQPAVPADQGLLLRSLQAGEWKPGRGHPQRNGAGGALQGQPGHGAQGDRRTGRPRTCWCAARARAPSSPPTPRSRRSTASCAEPDDGDRQPPAAPPARVPAHARPGRVARALDLQGRRRRWSQIRRLLLSGASAGGAGRHLAARRLFKGLTAERLAANRGPMYGLFESEFGVRMIRAEEKIRAVAAERRRRRCSRCRSGTPLLSSSGCPSPTATSRWNCAAACTDTERHHYRNELN
jgi:GntR family transcriptional regulator